VREERQELRLVVPLNASDVSLFPARDHSPVLPEIHLGYVREPEPPPESSRPRSEIRCTAQD
jgi:hypothetical protein